MRLTGLTNLIVGMLVSVTSCTTNTAEDDPDKGPSAIPCEAAFAAQRNRPPASVVTEGAYEPHNFLDENGVLVGWEVDYLEALMNHIGREYTLVHREWDGCCDVDENGDAVAPSEGDGLFAATHRGDFDFAIAGMAANGIRQQALNMTDSYGDTVHQHRIVFRAAADLDTTPLTGMQGARIAAQRGTTHFLYSSTRYPGATVVPTELQDDAFAMLLRGEVDAMLGSSDSSLLGQWFDGDETVEVDGVMYDSSEFTAGPEIVTVDPEGHDSAYGQGTAILLAEHADATTKRALNCAIEALAAPQEDGSVSALYQSLNTRWDVVVLPPGTPGLHGDDEHGHDHHSGEATDEGSGNDDQGGDDQGNDDQGGDDA